MPTLQQQISMHHFLPAKKNSVQVLELFQFRDSLAQNLVQGLKMESKFLHLLIRQVVDRNSWGVVCIPETPKQK
jgi:hypothetical protein